MFAILLSFDDIAKFLQQLTNLRIYAAGTVRDFVIMLMPMLDATWQCRRSAICQIHRFACEIATANFYRRELYFRTVSLMDGLICYMIRHLRRRRLHRATRTGANMIAFRQCDQPKPAPHVAQVSIARDASYVAHHA